MSEPTLPSPRSGQAVAKPSHGARAQHRVAPVRERESVPLLLPSQSAVLILAGGLGTRLRSATGISQKVLAPVGGQPFLDKILSRLDHVGFRQVVLCTGYRSEDVQRRYGFEFGQLELSYSEEEVPLGTGGALRWATDCVRSERILALNGDSYCDVDLLFFDQWATHLEASAALVATQVPDVARFGSLQLEGNNVLSFREKGAKHGAGWINAGIYSFTREFLMGLSKHGPLSLERDVLERLPAGELLAHRHVGSFLDIGTPESLKQAASFFAHDG